MLPNEALVWVDRRRDTSGSWSQPEWKSFSDMVCEQQDALQWFGFSDGWNNSERVVLRRGPTGQIPWVRETSASVTPRLLPWGTPGWSHWPSAGPVASACPPCSGEAWWEGWQRVWLQQKKKIKKVNNGSWWIQYFSHFGSLLPHLFFFFNSDLIIRNSGSSEDKVLSLVFTTCRVPLKLMFSIKTDTLRRRQGSLSCH